MVVGCGYCVGCLSVFLGERGFVFFIRFRSRFSFLEKGKQLQVVQRQQVGFFLFFFYAFGGFFEGCVQVEMVFSGRGVQVEDILFIGVGLFMGRFVLFLVLWGFRVLVLLFFCLFSFQRFVWLWVEAIVQQISKLGFLMRYRVVRGFRLIRL